MPPTAKLSRDFYDRFGDKVVDELVGLLNDMDATFRAELRELNERNFERFEARLRSELATLRTEFYKALTDEISSLRQEMTEQLAAIRTNMSDLKAELIKWMFLFWLGTVATMLSMGRLILGG